MSKEFDEIENFLKSNDIEDNGFSQRVVSSLPSEPRIVWLTSWLPVMGLLVGIAITWSLGALNIDYWQQGIEYLSSLENINLSQLILSIGMKEYLIIAAVVLVFAFKKRQEG